MLVLLENADMAEAENRHLSRESREVFSQLNMRVRVGSGCERNSLADCQLDNWVGGIEFVYWFAPAGGGKLNCDVGTANNFKCLIDQTGYVGVRAMTVDLD